MDAYLRSKKIQLKQLIKVKLHQQGVYKNIFIIHRHDGHCVQLFLGQLRIQGPLIDLLKGESRGRHLRLSCLLDQSLHFTFNLPDFVQSGELKSFQLLVLVCQAFNFDIVSGGRSSNLELRALLALLAASVYWATVLPESA